jgi:hypothetical protein
MAPSLRIASVLVLVLVMPGAARQSQPRTDIGSISGRVFAAGTGLPVPGAAVRLAGRQIVRASSAGDDGYFELQGIPPGEYLLTALSPGYAIGAHGQRTATEMPRSFALGAREARSGTDIQLTPLGKISGQIVDSEGRPAAKVQVQVFRKPQPGIGVDAPPNARVVAATTDATGAFTITGLAAGNYYVMAASRANDASKPGALPRSFQLALRAYYPGTSDSLSALPVRVDLGAETSNISFALQAARLGRIAGTVVDTRGRPAKDGVVLLNNAPNEVGEVMALGTYAEVGDDGSFVLRDVPVGLYSLDVWSKSAIEQLGTRGGGGLADLRQGSPEFASRVLRVGGDDVEDLMIRTEPGFRVSGKLVADGSMPRGAGPIGIEATSIAGASLLSRFLVGDAAVVQADGSFELLKLLGPQVLRASKLPDGWMLKQVKAAGLDVTDEGFEAVHDWSGVEVMVTRQTEIGGIVAERRGLPIPGTTVVVFAEDRRRWTLPLTRFVRTAVSNADGRYAIAGLPAGRYYAAAIPAVIEGKLTEPDDLEGLVPRASRFSLGEGERRTLDLRIE